MLLQISLDFLAQEEFFGILLINYIIFFGIMILSFVIGKIVVYFFDRYFKALAGKTDNKFDDLILEVFDKPLFYLFPLIGLLLAFPFLGIKNESLSSAYFNIIQILGILWGAWILVRLVDSLIKFFIKPLADKTESALDDQIIPVISKVAKLAIVAVVIIIILSSFGYDVTVLIAGLGIGGLALAFAAQKTVADVFGGVSIFTSKPFVMGDYIETAGVQGTVEEVGLRYSRIRNPDNKLITISNSEISSSVIINHSKAVPRGVTLKLGLVYSTKPKDLEKAIQIVKDIVNHTKGCQKEPLVYFDEFADSSLNIFARFFIEDADNWRAVKHEVYYKILDEFNKNKLDFAFPTQTIHLEK